MGTASHASAGMTEPSGSSMLWFSLAHDAYPLQHTSTRAPQIIQTRGFLLLTRTLPTGRVVLERRVHILRGCYTFSAGKVVDLPCKAYFYDYRLRACIVWQAALVKRKSTAQPYPRAATLSSWVRSKAYDVARPGVYTEMVSQILPNR
jgi:hypothetical protein